MQTIIDINKLKDIREVSVDRSLPKEARIMEHIRQLDGDPYHYRSGEYAVTEEYTPNGPTMAECLHGLML